MKKLLTNLLQYLGWYFAPDNHIVPVYRYGRYHRAAGPGFFWIIPFIESTLNPVKTSIHVGNFIFSGVLSGDNIPFAFHLTILFTFKPDQAIKAAAAQLVKGGDDLFTIIMRDFVNRRLRRLVALVQAQELCLAPKVANIERHLAQALTREMKALGLAPLKIEDGGVMIKEVVAPESFQQTMLDVKHDEAILEVLRSYPVPELVQLLNQVIFANSLKGRSGELALMMGTPNTMYMSPFKPSAGISPKLGNKNGTH